MALSLDRKVEVLEARSVEALIEYFEAAEPSKNQVEKARIGQATFASAQRRWATQNAHAALDFMLRREGLGRRQKQLPVVSDGGASG